MKVAVVEQEGYMKDSVHSRVEQRKHTPIGLTVNLGKWDDNTHYWLLAMQQALYQECCVM